MANTMCERVMDFLDNSLTKEYPSWLANHLQECQRCRRYARLSQGLRQLSLKKQVPPEDISWANVDRRPHVFRWIVATVAGAVFVVSIWIGIELSQPAESWTSADEANAISVTQTTTIDYYTKIALLW